jgi:hypothetical protein
MINKGQSLEGVVLEEKSVKQVNVRDAMVLAREGIVIPEQNIFYNDEDIEYDEDIDELVIASGVVNLSWEEKARRANEYREAGKEIMVNLSTHTPEIDDWITKNKKKLEALLKPIVINLFNAEKIMKE